MKFFFLAILTLLLSLGGALPFYLHIFVYKKASMDYLALYCIGVFIWSCGVTSLVFNTFKP